MKKFIFLVLLVICASVLFAQTIEDTLRGARLVREDILRSNGQLFLIQRMYEMLDGRIATAYWDIEGGTEVQSFEVSGPPRHLIQSDSFMTARTVGNLPGFIEYNFGRDPMLLSQFLQMLRMFPDNSDPQSNSFQSIDNRMRAQHFRSLVQTARVRHNLMDNTYWLYIGDDPPTQLRNLAPRPPPSSSTPRPPPSSSTPRPPSSPSTPRRHRVPLMEWDIMSLFSLYYMYNSQTPLNIGMSILFFYFQYGYAGQSHYFVSEYASSHDILAGALIPIVRPINLNLYVGAGMRIVNDEYRVPNSRWSWDTIEVTEYGFLFEIGLELMLSTYGFIAIGIRGGYRYSFNPRFPGHSFSVGISLHSID